MFVVKVYFSVIILSFGFPFWKCWSWNTVLKCLVSQFKLNTIILFFLFAKYSNFCVDLRWRSSVAYNRILIRFCSRFKIWGLAQTYSFLTFASSLTQVVVPTACDRDTKLVDDLSACWWSNILRNKSLQKVLRWHSDSVLFCRQIMILWRNTAHSSSLSFLLHIGWIPSLSPILFSDSEIPVRCSLCSKSRIYSFLS